MEIVSCFRILSSNEERKHVVFEAGAVRWINLLLKSEDNDLLKGVTKCMAHFTHGCNFPLADLVKGDQNSGFQRLLDLMNHPQRSIWEGAMACIVNLCYVHPMRPILGNLGAIPMLLEKVIISHLKIFFTTVVLAFFLTFSPS